MIDKIIIDSSNPKVNVVVKMENKKIEDIIFESQEKSNEVGSVYSGLVANVVDSLEAYFIDYGETKSGFLPFSSYPHALRKEDPVIVQISKNVKDNKGARMTGFIQFTGKYNTYAPYGIRTGMTSLIRHRKGIDVNYELIDEDLIKLKNIWQQILDKHSKGVRGLLHKEGSIIEKIIRDNSIANAQIVTNNKHYYQLIKQHIPEENVMLYDSEVPIFCEYGIMKEVQSLFKNKLTLPSGGSIVIDQTEAMVTVDVNSSSAGHGSLEENSYRVNMQAASEVAKQIRLRALSGIIAIDFIDMSDEKNIIRVEQEFRDSIKSVLESTRIGKINEFGVLMLSKKRGGFSVNEFFYEKHECGTVRSVISLITQILWEIELSIYSYPGDKITVSCDERVAEFLLNDLRIRIAQLEAKNDNTIRILPKSPLGIFSVTPAGVYETPNLEMKVLREIEEIPPLKSQYQCLSYRDYPRISIINIVSFEPSFIGLMT